MPEWTTDSSTRIAMEDEAEDAADADDAEAYEYAGADEVPVSTDMRIGL